MLTHSYCDDECETCGRFGLWDGCIAGPATSGGRLLQYGAARSSANALQSLSDPALTGKREQEILTPDWLTVLLGEEWGNIAMDPCSDASCSVPALIHYVWPRDNGLTLPWYIRTYANPPYGALKDWLAKAVEESRSDLARIALLAPARTHRKWYRAALDTTTAVVELDPLKFKGYDSTFPAPLHLLCWGWVPNSALWAQRGTVRNYHRTTELFDVPA